MNPNLGVIKNVLVEWWNGEDIVIVDDSEVGGNENGNDSYGVT